MVNMSQEGDKEADDRLLHEKLADEVVKSPKSGKNQTVKIIPQSDDQGVDLKRKKNESNMQKWKLVPPDGGWGWLVLFGSTLVNILVPGTVKSFGVLFVEFLEVFEASAAAAAWIPALCYFLYSSLGPVSSILSLRYSYRTVTLLGGTFAAFGMMLSYFAGSVAYLCVSYGVLVGIGAGLSFPPTVYIVTSYFERLRGLANGLCISGSAIGSIILPPVLRILLELYGYRGAVLLMGGLTLNVWVAALFYDPVEKHLKKVPIEDVEAKLVDQEQPKFMISTEDSMGSIPHNDSFVSDKGFSRSASTAAMQSYAKSRERKISMPTRTSVGSPTTTSNSALHAVPECGSLITSQERLPMARRSRTPCRSPSSSSFQYVSTPYHGSTLTLQPETFASSFSLKMKKGEERKNKFFDLSVLKDPIYLIILISNSTNAISYTNFIILLPSYSLQLGFDKTMGALLLSVVSALDLVGRIGGSALSDLPICPKEWYFIGGMFLSGVSLALLPFTANYSTICVYCALFGLASGVYVGVTAVLMADMLGTERIQSTYGISLFVNGVLQLVGPPICGVWATDIDSYVLLFCVLGIVLIVGAAIWGFLPFVRKKPGYSDKLQKTDCS